VYDLHFLARYFTDPISVACGCSLAEIMGSNPAGACTFFTCEFCVILQVQSCENGRLLDQDNRTESPCVRACVPASVCVCV
jgi:hypothetical protein